MGPENGTAHWIKEQWSNPSDIFSILLIIGGDIVRMAIAQLCAGPIPHVVPVSFSFGWVSYAISAMRSALGENRLMPKPEHECKLINAETGYSRPNHSWILSRMLRDFESWRPKVCDKISAEKLERLRAKQMSPSSARIALRVTVWQCNASSGKGSGDCLYWMGLVVSALQIALAAVPWGLYREWFTFLITVAGTVLAYASGALPQWTEEKSDVRRLERPKQVTLTEGNGAQEALLIIAEAGDLDLEALAAPQRQLKHPSLTRLLSIALAVLWVALLLTVAGWSQHTWYLVGIGMIGMLHNVAVAAMARQPKAWGIDLEYRQTIVEAKVMEVLYEVERAYPGAGASLLPEFFPGRLFPREKLLWSYLERRQEAWKHDRYRTSQAWCMPPLRRPASLQNDDDVPAAGPYEPAVSRT